MFWSLILPQSFLGLKRYLLLILFSYINNEINLDSIICTLFQSILMILYYCMSATFSAADKTMMDRLFLMLHPRCIEKNCLVLTFWTLHLHMIERRAAKQMNNAFL